MPATTLKKWGNSSGILIPKSVLSDVGWKLGDEIALTLKNDKLELQKKNKKRTARNVVNLDKLFQNWDKEYKLPYDLKSDTASSTQELDWGAPQGCEI